MVNIPFGGPLPTEHEEVQAARILTILRCIAKKIDGRWEVQRFFLSV